MISETQSVQVLLHGVHKLHWAQGRYVQCTLRIKNLMTCKHVSWTMFLGFFFDCLLCWAVLGMFMSNRKMENCREEPIRSEWNLSIAAIRKARRNVSAVNQKSVQNSGFHKQNYPNLVISEVAASSSRSSSLPKPICFSWAGIFNHFQNR